ncbi:hypothetical protein [Stygiolobus caldivivus]|uniref:Cellulase n=1 Tax=Stygiolobus caldivivus TaxID=2824673 RepID=A0A8D5ZJ36_9CREN|nr:hypothetical protein [Stygiolobus caldivivus]BCU69945.1 hypothetical protein KN1_12420 [Stygiolobus caldivivus]
MDKRVTVIIALLLVVSALAFIYSKQGVFHNSDQTAPPTAPFTTSTALNSPAVRDNTGVDLMGFNTSFSLIGERGPTLSYPIAEVYGPENSLLTSTFLWNMKSSNGVVNMTFYRGLLNVSVNLSSFEKIQTGIPVDGYPGLMYGKECWFPFYGSTLTLPQLPLPQKITSLPDFYSRVDFRLYQLNGSIDDFSYDIWLSQDPNVTVLHYPCIEVMVWMYHEEDITSQYFLKEGSVTVTAVINGSVENESFTVYVLPHTGSAGGWVGVYYVSQNELEGNVSLPLSYFIKQSVYFAGKVFPTLSPAQYYLDAIQVGMEFNNTPQGIAKLGYTLYGWWLYFNSTTATSS